MKQTLKDKKFKIHIGGGQPMERGDPYYLKHKDFKEHYANTVRKINAENKLTKGKVFRILQEEFGNFDEVERQ